MNNRLYYVDAARCCACLLVVASHVFAPICAGLYHYSAPTWWFFNLFDSVIRPSAGIYVMISGILFLGSSREDGYFTFIWKRYAKLIPPFLVWSFIYAFYDACGNDEPFRWGQTALQILQGPTAYHLWFMYMILALYLVMPILRRFVQAATPADLATSLALWMGFLTLKFLAPDYIGDGPITTLVSYGGYTVLGYTLSKTDSFQKSTPGWVSLWAGIVVFNAVGTYWLTLQNAGTLNEKLYFGASPLVAIQATAMFVLLKRLDHDSVLFSNSWLHAMVKRFSRHSYNIYLNHALFIGLLTNGYLGFAVSEKTGPNALVGVGLTTALVLAASLALSLFVEQIPILSKLLILSPPRDIPPPLKIPPLISLAKDS